MIPMPIPIWIIAAGTAAVVSGVGVWRVMDWRCDAARVEAVERAIAQARQIADQDAEVAAAYEATRERIRTVTNTRIEEIIRHAAPSIATCSMDADGLRILNDALADAPADPGKPDYTLPGTATLKGWFND